MLYIVECKLLDFEAWSGGADTLKELTINEIEDLEILIDNQFRDIPKEFEINDFLWFERDLIAYYLGYKDWQDLYEKKHHQVQ